MTRSRFAASLFVCLIAVRAQAQMLPLRHYTTSNGLAHNVVTSLYEDSRGYLWIGTVEGASRFDGEEIVTYGRRHALPSSLVTGFLETPDQQLWLATSPTDVFRFDERAFTFERVTIASEPGAHRVLTLAVTDHALWAATDAGLYRRPFSPAGGVFERVLASDDAENAGPSLTDSRGRVWIGLRHRLLLLTDTAREVHALPASPERPNDIVAILEDARGGLAVVSLQGVSRRTGDAAPFAGVPLPLAAGEQIYAGVMTGETLWLGTSQALLRVEPGRVLRYTAAHGIPPPVLALARSRTNQLWIGTTTGLRVLLREGSYGVRPTEGEPVLRLLPASDHLIAATTKALIRINAAGDASPIIARVPGVGARIARGPRGTWWLATRDAIFMAEGSPSAPAAPLGAAHGLVPGAGVFEIADQETAGMHMDAAGTMWLASADDRLYRCDVARDFTPICAQVAHDGLSWRNRPVVMTDDRAGTLWVASVSGLGRLRGTTFEAIGVTPPPKGRPELTPALLVDSQQRLWVGLHHQGLALSRSPRDAAPAFEFFDKTRGLSSDAVHGIAEGRAGVIYAATGRGLDVLRPVGTGFEPAAVDLGFDTGQVRDVAVERERLWMASANGVYWHDLGAPAPGDGAPHVFVTRLTVRGTEWPIPERGLQRVSGLVFEPDADHLQIEFLAPHIGMPSPRYQHRLGPGHEWSALTAAHAVTLTGLRPDHYAFEVRAVTASGTASAPAVMEFELLAPVWQRWWFRGALVLLAVAAAAAGHRFRLRQVLALERVRSQIAADLHDDIGSRLAEMAVVSELGARDGDRPSRDRFAQLAATARDVRQTMSDVVWAIDPRRDHLIDLVGRTRQAAEALLTTEVGFRLNLPSPEAMQHVTLGLDQRRQIVLLVREALVNVQKHANATSVVITFSVQDATLTIVVEDDGVGIDRARPTDGYGIVSMERRAAALGGRLAIASRPEGGTTLTLTVPLDLGWWGTRRMNG